MGGTPHTSLLAASGIGNVIVAAPADRASLPPLAAALFLSVILLVVALWAFWRAGTAKREVRALRRHHALHQAMFARLPAAVFQIDSQGHVLSWNPSAERMFGWSAAEVTGKPLPIVPPESRGEFAALRRRTLEEGRITDVRVVRRRKDGSLLTVSLSASPIRDEDGRPAGIIASMVDISDRVAAEQAQRRHQEMLARTERIAHVGSWTWDLQADQIIWSEELHSITGCDPSQPPPSFEDHSRFLPPEDFRRLKVLVEAAVAEGKPYEMECQVVRPGGERRHCLVRGFPEATPDGRTQRLYGFVQDITGKKQAELKHGQLQAAIDQAAECVLIADAEGAIQYVNPAFERITGYSPEEVTGLNPRILKSGCHDEEFYRQMWDTLLAGRTWRGEITNRRKDGTLFTEEAAISPVTDASGQIVSYTAIKHDITERKRAEERIHHLNLVLRAVRGINKLLTQEKTPRDLIDKACRLLVDLRSYNTAMIVLTDATGRPVDATHAGVDPGMWQAIQDHLDKQERPRCFEVMSESGMPITHEDRRDLCMGCPSRQDCEQLNTICTRLTSGGRNHGYLAVSLKPELGADEEERALFQEMAGDLAYALRSMEDHSGRLQAERERADVERQLVESQKMEMMGQLAGGIAHDFNNILQGIIGYADILLHQAEMSGQPCQEVQNIAHGAERAASLTRQLLTFSRRQVMEARMVDLNAVVDDLFKMLRRLIGAHIDVQWQPHDSLPATLADPSMAEQVLMNLCLNARDAMPEGGTLTISTDVAEVDAAHCARHPHARPGRYIRLDVADTGCGIQEEYIEKVFEPFFTTKPEGKGTGLGLSIVYGIVRQHEGFIEVNSEPGRGSSFGIYLPLKKRPEREEQVPRPESGAQGHGTILLAEDDTLVRNLMVRVLESAGYTVLPAADGNEALRIFREATGRIHLLMTDVIMPGITGDRLLSALREEGAQFPVLFCSGYGEIFLEDREILLKDHLILRKPFSNRDLLDHVRRALGRAVAS